MPWVERIATLENTLAEVKTGRLGDTLGNLQAEALVKTLPYTLVVVKSIHFVIHETMCRPKH